jgi:hypothetical protein
MESRWFIFSRITFRYVSYFKLRDITWRSYALAYHWLRFIVVFNWILRIGGIYYVGRSFSIVCSWTKGQGICCFFVLVYILFCNSLGWSGTESTLTDATTNLLCQPRMMMDDERGAVNGILGIGNRNTRRKPALVPISPPQIPHYLTRVRRRTAAVGIRELRAWAMARPYILFTCLFNYCVCFWMI